MSGKNGSPIINEMYDRKFALIFGVMLVFYAVCAVIVGALGPKSFSEEAMKLLPIVMLVGAAVALVAFIRCLVCKVHIDERGVDVNNPFTGRVDFRWDELRTAAVVNIGVGVGKGQPVIILSTLEPREVLTRRALVDGRGLSRREHVRIMYSKARQECVEHYLRMKLPEIDV